MKKKPVTAGEVMDRLETDPTHQARLAELARQEREASLAEAPLLKDLEDVGIRVASVWFLAARAEPYPTALPILIEHFKRSYPIEIKEGIARALAVRESKVAWNLLLQLYKSEQEPRLRGALALALSEASHDGVIEDVIALATDQGNGPSRLHLLPALKRSKDPRAIETIEALATDPAFSYEVAKYLRARAKRAGRDRRRDHK